MENLAGSEIREACEKINEELKAAGIPAVRMPTCGNREVKCPYVGMLGNAVFARYWYYWGVSNVNVPYNVAVELYENPIGKTDIRINGHCGCPSPEESIPEWSRNDAHFGSIHSYHIDTAEGLKLFVDTLKKYHIFPDVDYSLRNDFPIQVEDILEKYHSDVTLPITWSPTEKNEMKLSNPMALELAIRIIAEIASKGEINRLNLRSQLEKLYLI